MAKKELPPTGEEIKEVVRQFTELSIDQLSEMKFWKDKRNVIIKRTMTVMLMAHSPDEGREDVWKFCKELSRRGHAPVKPAEYARMQPYIENEALIDAVYGALDEIPYPYDFYEFQLGCDMEGYFYCIALLSQAKYRRGDCIELLKRICGFIAENVTHNTPRVVMSRNMRILGEQYPDLKEIKLGWEE